MKKSIFVRFANESTYYTHIKIDITKIQDVMMFTKEVFFTVDGIRVAVKKEDWDNLNK